MPVHAMDVNAGPTQAQEEARMIDVFPRDRKDRHIIPYRPNYLLPLYYSVTPDRQIYAGNTPDNEAINRKEVKFQISFRIPVMRISAVDVSVAYTQLSYWQLYQPSGFFRENNYEPAAFLSSDKRLRLGNWEFGITGIGAVHESNGQGGALQRSWNRLFFEGTVRHHRLSLDYRLWYVLKDRSYRLNNPDMAHYLGYGRWVLSYHLGGHTFSVLSRNNINSGFDRGFTQVSWSFPLTWLHITGVQGYVQFSSGYGQSLIEYNHRTNAYGAGVSFSDW